MKNIFLIPLRHPVMTIGLLFVLLGIQYRAEIFSTEGPGSSSPHTGVVAGNAPPNSLESEVQESATTGAITKSNSEDAMVAESEPSNSLESEVPETAATGAIIKSSAEDSVPKSPSSTELAADDHRVEYSSHGASSDSKVEPDDEISVAEGAEEEVVARVESESSQPIEESSIKDSTAIVEPTQTVENTPNTDQADVETETSTVVNPTVAQENEAIVLITSAPSVEMKKGEVTAVKPSASPGDPKAVESEDIGTIDSTNAKAAGGLSPTKPITDAVGSTETGSEFYAQLAKARALSLQGHIPAALFAYQRLVSDNPKQLDARGEWADLLLRARQWDMALQQYVMVIQGLNAAEQGDRAMRIKQIIGRYSPPMAHEIESRLASQKLQGKAGL